MKTGIHPDEALALVLDGTIPLVEENLPLAECLGRVLARPLPALADSPPFDKSAMDGWALAAPGPGGAEAGWRPVASLAARPVADLPRLAPGEACRIMTGAPVPPGTAGVLRLEWSAQEASGLVRPTRAEPSDNIIRRGENLRAGDSLLEPCRLEAADIGVAASGGYGVLPVRTRPRLAVLSSGDELVAPGEAAGLGQIPDSNGPQLLAQALDAGAVPVPLGWVPDDPAAIRRALAGALEDCDIVVASGGVSLGDFDHIPASFVALGVQPAFHQLAMRPGKPTWYGRRARIGGGVCHVIGLPGNPVSTFVNFEVFVRPLVYALAGLVHRPPIVTVPLADGISRRNTATVEWFPVRLEHLPGGGLQAVAMPYRGSSMLNVLTGAHGLACYRTGQEKLEAGGMVDVRLIRPLD
jgi:molybdopterin molybdotransferase